MAAAAAAGAPAPARLVEVTREQHVSLCKLGNQTLAFLHDLLKEEMADRYEFDLSDHTVILLSPIVANKVGLKGRNIVMLHEIAAGSLSISCQKLIRLGGAKIRMCKDGDEAPGTGSQQMSVQKEFSAPYERLDALRFVFGKALNNRSEGFFNSGLAIIYGSIMRLETVDMPDVLDFFRRGVPIALPSTAAPVAAAAAATAGPAAAPEPVAFRAPAIAAAAVEPTATAEGEDDDSEWVHA